MQQTTKTHLQSQLTLKTLANIVNVKIKIEDNMIDT